MPYHTNQNNNPTPSSKGNYSSPNSRGSHNKTPVSDTTSTVSATTSSIDNIILDDKTISNKIINRSFGAPDDYIELHI